jgi:hypothetical protein
MDDINNTFKHREPWLHAVMEKMKPLFVERGFRVPENVRLTCGFPSSRAFAAQNQRTGECWSDENSKDGHFEIMVSPTIDDPMQVAGVLAHELCHACVGIKEGHKGPFKTLALAIGLEGKMTATTEGEAFKRYLTPILEDVGPYPHAEISKLVVARKKQTTRLIKLKCPMCKYSVRITQMWLEDPAFGAPCCPKDGDRLETDKVMPGEVEAAPENMEE